MNFTIPLFERRVAGFFQCATLGLGPFGRRREGRNLHKVHELLQNELRFLIGAAKGRDLARLQMAKGLRLERVRLTLTLAGSDRRKVSGVYPIVVEPRWASADERFHVAYHPLFQDDAIPIKPELPLDEQLRAHLSRVFADLDDEAIDALACQGRERIDVISFSCDTRSLLDDLPSAGRSSASDGDPAPRRKRRRLQILPQLGVDLGERAARGDLDIGVPRSPYRERIQLLLGAGKSRPMIIVGPPGSGKTTLIHHAVADLLEIDGYPAHRNLDRVRPVYRISGRRLIAGMSRLGEWEKRCVEVVEDARSRDVVLVLEDVAHFGSIGRSRESDRSLADFFRGPLARREIVMIGECTEEELRRLAQDAPAFASLFASIHVTPTTPSETLRLLVREMRREERQHKVIIRPHALRAVLDLSGSLLSSRSFPGKAIDLLREVCQTEPSRGGSPIESEDVLDLISAKTGVPEILLRGDARLDPAEVESALARQVMGQDEAVKVAADLVCRVKAGLVDPRRPYGVYLFTGPTGTGKTELAKCLAEFLYGSQARMIRFDMSELAGPDAPARLIGHRWRPDGLLTQRVLEQPFSLVLLDEIEKAHPSVLSLLLQLFEDGRLTDAAGRTAHFQHAVVIMTSNLGARPRPAVGFGEATDAILHDIARAVREFFPPELWNRIDRIVPFRPLTADVAARVAQKELDRLTRRRGLAERSIFVDIGPGVAERVAEEAFAARDGARSVKRFLEDRIGSALSAAITEGQPAAMQLLHLSVEGDGFAVQREALVEASPVDARWALAPLFHLPIARIKERLPELLGFVDALLEEGHLARLSDRIRFHLAQQGRREHAEAVYNLDSMRADIQAFRARIEQIRASDEDDHELLEMERFGFTTITTPEEAVERIRLFRRDQMPVRVKHLLKAEILECLAEGYWLRRALRHADDPTQHAIFVEITRAADLDDRARFAAAEPGLVEWLAAIYADARGEVEAWASSGHAGDRCEGLGGSALLHPDPARGGRYVLKIVGLCVRDFFGLEDGTHVWTSLGRGPEVVRVRVYPAISGEMPADVLARPPVRALPEVVRKLRFDPPRAGGPPVPFEIEDYVMGHADTVHARSLADALAPLWLLRASRDDDAEGMEAAR
ncbi:ATP-dependent Clp protease ATP-binding subunit ClpA [Minicystis rosea]|nr:ATP-dependent Clp protease ATP-binding subunit ClpA [Minicystis rosea]